MSIVKTISDSNKPTLKAAIILAVIILIAYSSIIFVNHTYNSSVPAGTDQYQKKYAPFPITIDPGADFAQIWPEHALAAKEYQNGTIPLWNPYMAAGQPLAADSDNYIFSPLFVIFLLPSSVWDVGLLVAVWGAGVLMFAFLRNISLGFHSSLVGGMFYMLSGAFTWYLPHTSIPVILFTPFILYSMEKLLQSKDPRYIPIASIAIACSILGAHIETIVLQTILVTFYLAYRIIRQHFYKQGNTEHRPSTRRVVASSLISYCGGFGASSFFIIPLSEFLKNGALGHDSTAGVSHAQTYVIATNFIPYIIGPVQTYWNAAMELQGNWNVLWGYVGVFALFFSILGIAYTLKNRQTDSLHKYTPIFFLVISIFFIMKNSGVLITNWIGYIPVLDHIVFTRYSGAVIPIGFAVAGAFGIEYLLNSPNPKKIGIVGMITIVVILLTVIPMIPYLSHQKSAINQNDVRNYVGFQIIQAVTLAVLAFVSSVAVSRNKSTITGLISLVCLELSLYIPMGVDPIWMAYKGIIVILAMALITFIVIKPNKITWSLQEKKLRFTVIAVIVICTATGIVFLSVKSPYEMVHRHDAFASNQLTQYIKENIGYSRIFSLTSSLGPNYPSAYNISTLGMLSAFSPSSFHSFIHQFFDPAAWGDTPFGYPPWTGLYGPSVSQEKITDAKKYFDFMGVKYFITQNYDLDTHMIGPNKTITSNSIPISNTSNITQSFVSPSDSISGIGMSFYVRTLENTGKIRLVLDSIPYDAKYHRESDVNITSIKNTDFVIFRFVPIANAENKQFKFTLDYPQSNRNNIIKTYFFENDGEYKYVKNNLGGIFYQNEKQEDDKELAFLIIQNPNFVPEHNYYNLNIIENKNAFPRAYLVEKYQLVKKDTAFDFLKNNPDFDLRHDVILEEQPPRYTSQSQQDTANTTEIKSYTENNVKITTKSTTNTILILTDVYYPGWKAFIDNNETSIYKADGIVRAIFVPAGIHTIEFSYQPESFMIGLEISLVTFIIMTIVLTYYTIKKKHTLDNNAQNVHIL